MYVASQSLFAVKKNPFETFLMQPVLGNSSNVDNIIIIAALNRLLIVRMLLIG